MHRSTDTLAASAVIGYRLGESTRDQTMHFTKRNSSGDAKAPFIEADGLALLRRSVSADLRIPEPLAVSATDLQLPFIDNQPADAEAWQALGRGLAALHRPSHPQFGLDYDNYIGRNPQRNCLSDNWGAFFVDYRLQPQIGWIRSTAERESLQGKLQRNRAALVDFLNAHCEQASLVHGDLWQGNVLVDTAGAVWLIDPAVYFADREVDIAMSEMFGGFHPAFYQAYSAAYPLSRQYPLKRVIYNLYHYLNHYNLFGDGYLDDCHRAFAQISEALGPD